MIFINIIMPLSILNSFFVAFVHIDHVTYKYIFSKNKSDIHKKVNSRQKAYIIKHMATGYHRHHCP